MMKRFLSGVMAAALVVTGASCIAPSADAAAKAPKAAYTFNFNKANKKVVAVARKGDKNMKSKTGKNSEGKTANLPVLPTEKVAKQKKIKVKYTKGKHGKGLNLTRKQNNYGYGVELKGIKLTSASWTVSFWVKANASMSDYMPIFFTENAVAEKKAKWLSITKASWIGNLSPVIWSTNNTIKNKKGEIAFPWYADNDWGKYKDKCNVVQKGKWVHIVLVCDSRDTKCVYAEGEDSEYKGGYHGWTYVNGVLFGNGSIAKGAVTSKNRYFLGINAWDYPFSGVIDDLQIYKSALSAKQVYAIYKSQK